MGSSFLNTPYKPWTPADAVLRDCSQGICSFFCPQWCSVIYPPPPSPSIIAIGVAATAGGDDDDSSSSSSFRLSPLIVALIGILASAFVLITYYTIISRLCTRRTRIHQNDTNQWENDNDESAIQASANTGGSGGLDDAVIRSITVRKYQKGDGSVEGTDCSVCLSEFQDRENLRLLPKCNHAFHLPCIDTWLRSHSSCPLCRSDIIISDTSSSSSSSGNLPNQRENVQFQEASRTQSVNVSSALEYQYRNDTVIVIHRSEQENQVGFAGNLEESNGSELNQGRLLSVADILRSSEEDEDEDAELEIGSSKQNQRQEEKRKVRSE